MKILFLSDFVPTECIALSYNFDFLLRDADYIVFNLEGSPRIPDQENVKTQIMPFEVKDVLNFVSKYGKEKFIIALANNHILDNGLDAFDYLINCLDHANVKYFGTLERPYVTVNDVKLLNFVTAETVADFTLGRERLNYLFYNCYWINKQIQKIESECDKLVMYPHWGRDMDTKVFTTYTKKIRKGKKWITFGHHPHVISGIKQDEIYSLGNTYIPHPYYYEKYEATRYGLSVSLNSETMKYKTYLTEVKKDERIFTLNATLFDHFPSEVISPLKVGLVKKIFLRIFSFDGTSLDFLRLNLLQLMRTLFSIKYKLMNHK